MDSAIGRRDRRNQDQRGLVRPGVPHEPPTPAPRARSRPASTITMAVVAVAGVCVASCTSTPRPAIEVRSNAPRAKAISEDAVGGASIARNVAARLYPALAKEAGSGNIAYSPTSIAVALGMARAGARDASAQQLDRFLGSPGPALDRGLNGLSWNLSDRAGKRKDVNRQDAMVELELANSFWGQRDISWKRPFLDVLGREYGTGMFEVDYEKDAAGSRLAVNRWVAEQTHGKIPDLVKPNVFDSQTRLSLVNALYFAAPWAAQFDGARTRPFTTVAGTKVDASMMHHLLHTTYRRGDHWQAVTIPYAGNELAMTLLVPDAGSLATVEASLDPAFIDILDAPAAPDSSANRAVNLTMPIFDLDDRPDLTAALKAVGVTAPFTTTVDFRPITTDPRAPGLQLAEVVHQATVSVDEKGTVASAATVDVFRATGAPVETKPPIDLVVDRPFLFLITDLVTHAPLFIGRVADPTKP